MRLLINLARILNAEKFRNDIIYLSGCLCFVKQHYLLVNFFGLQLVLLVLYYFCLRYRISIVLIINFKVLIGDRRDIVETLENIAVLLTRLLSLLVNILIISWYCNDISQVVDC